MTLHDANLELDRVFGGEEGDSPIRFQAHCTHGGRPCPKVIQAIPLPSVREAHNSASCLPSLIVGAVVVGLFLLEGLVPRIAAFLGSVLP